VSGLSTSADKIWVHVGYTSCELPFQVEIQEHAWPKHGRLEAMSHLRALTNGWRKLCYYKQQVATQTCLNSL